MTDYDPDKAVERLGWLMAEAAQEGQIADALRSHADDHERTATGFERTAAALRTRLEADGHLPLRVAGMEAGRG